MNTAPTEHATADALILGIESSCDETAAAVVRGGHAVLSNVIATQAELHVEYGGVVPEIASRAHIERIGPVVQRALSDAGLTWESARDHVAAIAVGHRPGLIGSLLIGVTAAKALAWAWDKPLIGVDHIMAHLHAGSLNTSPPNFPALGLVVSGGHTSLFRMGGPTEMELLGRTIDDAIGEAYDKAAIMLGLGFPGGPIVDRRAQLGDSAAERFPVSLLGKASLDFSFSGLKTALLYAVRGLPEGRGKTTTFTRDAGDLPQQRVNDLCASFQAAAVEAVMLKIERALEAERARGIAIQALVIGGGVSANSRLRAQAHALAARRGLSLHLPAQAYCVDNAAMIAGLGYHLWKAGHRDGLELAAAPAGTY